MAAIPDDIDASWIDVSQLDKETGQYALGRSKVQTQQTNIQDTVDWTLPENAKKLERNWGNDDKELWRFSWLPVGVATMAGAFLLRRFF
jgi:hypothetical protein